MTILELFNQANSKPVLIYKGTQYLLVQTIINDGTYALGVNMELNSSGEGFQGLGSWATVASSSTGWNLVE